MLANAALTGMFGWAHAGGTFGCLIMLLFFDGAAVSWYLARKKDGLSSTQRATAKLMSIFTIVASTLVSVVQVLLTTTLVRFSPADLTVIGKGGLILVTVAAAANFFALFIFAYFSIEEQSTEQQEELRARSADERQQMIAQAHEKAHAKARQRLMMKTDEVAERMAKDAEKEFYAAMGFLDMYEEPTLPHTVTAQQIDLGAAAGAKEVETQRVLAATPQDLAAAAEIAPDCECGVPIGTGEGFCDYELGGPGCMIDMKAAEAKASREADPLPPADMEPLDLTGAGK